MLDKLYDDLPEDNELAFLKLERAYREICERDALDAIHHAEPGYVPDDVYLRYMRQTSAAAEELQLPVLSQLNVPSAENFSYTAYQNFLGRVDHFRTALQIRQARRKKGYSVQLDEKTRRKINHYLGQVREIIIGLEVDEWKRDSLLTCLNNLQNEFDKNRSGYEVFGAFIIEFAGVLGEAAEKLEPVRKIIDSVAGLLWGAKHAEEVPRLPPASEPKQIPAPRPADSSGANDEIPF